MRVKTSDIEGAGTDANVHIRLIGEIVESGDLQLIKSESNKNTFKRGQVRICNHSTYLDWKPSVLHNPFIFFWLYVMFKIMV